MFFGMIYEIRYQIENYWLDPAASSESNRKSSDDSFFIDHPLQSRHGKLRCARRYIERGKPAGLAARGTRGGLQPAPRQFRKHLAEPLTRGPSHLRGGLMDIGIKRDGRPHGFSLIP